MKNIINLLFALAILTSGCKKLIEVDSPKNQLSKDKVFADTTSAFAALANTYALFNETIEPSLTRNLSMYTGELAYTNFAADDLEFSKGRVTPANYSNLNLWKGLYLAIYQCNDILEQVPKSVSLSSAATSSLVNEAKFLRAYAYFYLAGLYGKVPLLLSTDVNANRLAFQNDSLQVYHQIVQDLQDAQHGLPSFNPAGGKVRAGKWAATALLARVHAYLGNWTEAEFESSPLIEGKDFSPLDVPELVFKTGSKEAIFQFYTPKGYVNTSTSLLPDPSATVPTNPITDDLYTAFESGDLRKQQWIGTLGIYHYPSKYKNRLPNTDAPEYLMSLRLAEQYLIRAEARTRTGKLTGENSAASDLNVIRKRAGLADTNAQTQKELLAAIEQERKVELFCEWADRFLYLKRSGKLPAPRLPIPQNELTYNHNLVQNPGY